MVTSTPLPREFIEWIHKTVRTLTNGGGVQEQLRANWISIQTWSWTPEKVPKRTQRRAELYSRVVAQFKKAAAKWWQQKSSLNVSISPLLTSASSPRRQRSFCVTEARWKTCKWGQHFEGRNKRTIPSTRRVYKEQAGTGSIRSPNNRETETYYVVQNFSEWWYRAHLTCSNQNHQEQLPQSQYCKIRHYHPDCPKHREKPRREQCGPNQQYTSSLLHNLTTSE